MWLKLDLSGIKLSMQIRNYRKVSDDDWDSVWCKTDFAFVSDEWLNYRKDNDEVFLAREIEDLAKSLDDLLNDRLNAPTEFNCIEPDFNFILNPKKDLRLDPKVLYVRPGCEIVDIDMEWKISFLDEGLTDNYLSQPVEKGHLSVVFFSYKERECGIMVWGDKNAGKERRKQRTTGICKFGKHGAAGSLAAEDRRSH